MRLAALPAALLLGVSLAATAGDTSFEAEARGEAFREGDPARQIWLETGVRYTEALGRRVTLTVAARLEADSHGDTDRGVLYDAEDRDLLRALLRFEDLKLTFDLGSLDLVAGRQRIVWARTDGVNPVDNLTPRDWTDPLDEVRLSSWALRALYERGRWSADLALVPHFAPSRLPALNGRWLRPAPLSLENPAFPAAGPPELATAYEWGEADFPHRTLETLQRGIRVGRRGRAHEWAFSYFRGFDDAARISARILPPDLGAGTLPLLLDRSFPRLDVVGLDGVVLAGSWTVRYEAGRFEYDDETLDDTLSYQLDVGWSRGPWAASFGYAGLSGADEAEEIRDVLAEASRGGGSPGHSIRTTAALDLGPLPALFLRAGWSRLAGPRLALEAAVGTEDGDALVRVSASRPVAQRVRLGVELVLIHGPGDSFFGRWRDSDRLRIFVRCSL